MTSTIDLTGEDEVFTTRNTSTYQVNVKLRSLDGGLDRSILLSEKVGLLTADVGRSSKNLEREMNPQRGNAWIDSPVMSRRHALLFLEPGGEKMVYLQDLKSTHGTKLNGRRIIPYQKVPLTTGDHLSFGATVLAGSEIFKAKEFEAVFRWENIRTSPIVLTPSSVDEAAPRTYSVPSPGPSEDEILSDDENEPPETIPIHKLSAKKPPTAPPLPSNDVDSTHNAVDKELTNNQDGTPARVSTHSHGDNEEYGNESLSASKSAHSSERPSISSLRPGRTTSRPDSTTVLHTRRSSYDTPRSPSYSPSSPAWSTHRRKSSTSDEQEVTDPKVGDNSIEAQPNQRCIKSSDIEFVHTDFEYDREHREWFDEEDDQDNIDEDLDNIHSGEYPSDSDHNSVSSSVESESADDMNDEDHVISTPSDENEKKSDMPRNNTTSLMSLLNAAESSWRCVEQRRGSSPSDAAMAKPIALENVSKETGEDVQVSRSGHYPPLTVFPPTDTPPEVNLHSDIIRQPLMNDQRGYSQGPFALPDNLGRPNHTPQLPFGYRMTSAAEDRVDQTTMPYYGGDQLIDMELGFANRSTLHPVNSRMEPLRYWAGHMHQPPPLNVNDYNSIADPSSCKQPKLAISHLVNNLEGDSQVAPSIFHEEVQNPRKRKVNELATTDNYPQSVTTDKSFQQDQVSIEGEMNSPIAVDIPEIPKQSEVADAKLLPNAQAREELLAPEGSFAAPIVIEEEKPSEPAHKKVKTIHHPNATSAPRGVRRNILPWLRKAASHALYGGAWAAVGATAAVAALIATVPEEVQHEAFSEL